MSCAAPRSDGSVRRKPWCSRRGRPPDEGRRAGARLVPRLDLDTEALAERPELLMQYVEVLADIGEQLGGVLELAVAVALVVGQVSPHRGFGLSGQRSAG